MANIKLKDKFGQDVVYQNKSTITVKDENGNNVVYKEKSVITIDSNLTVVDLSFRYCKIQGIDKLILNFGYHTQTLSTLFMSANFGSSTEIEMNFLGDDTHSIAIPKTITDICSGATFKKLTFRNTHFEDVTTWAGTFGNCNIEEFDGEFDLSKNTSTSGTAPFRNNTKLKEIRFVPNCIKSTLMARFDYLPLLSDVSIVSICNALNESVSDQTFQFSGGSTPTAKLNTIVGTVSLDQTGTYHIFTADDTGTTTLRNFVTNTKGWTII